MGSKLLCWIYKNITDGPWPFWKIRIWYLRDFLWKTWEIYRKCSNSANFWARKMFFFLKWVRISPEIDWYHYQCASPAPTCIVRHRILIKTPTRWSVTSEPSVPPSVEQHSLYGIELSWKLYSSTLEHCLLKGSAPVWSSTFWKVLLQSGALPFKR